MEAGNLTDCFSSSNPSLLQKKSHNHSFRQGRHLKATPKANLTNKFDRYSCQRDLTMEVCEQNEAFAEEDGDLSFHHTKIILRDGIQYFLKTAM